MESKIVMRFARESIREFRFQDKWEFRPVGRLAFLQKAAWKFLQRFGALQNSIGQAVEYKEVVIDRQSVADTIMDSMCEMQIAYIKPARVYMGPEQFSDVAREAPQAINFSVPFGHDREIFDLPVTIIPWMRGVLVVPA